MYVWMRKSKCVVEVPDNIGHFLRVMEEADRATNDEVWEYLDAQQGRKIHGSPDQVLAMAANRQMLRECAHNPATPTFGGKAS